MMGGGKSVAVILGLQRNLLLETREKNPIQNISDHSPLGIDFTAKANALINQYPPPRFLHRPLPPTTVYNCHGLTFGSRRTQIVQANEVRRILNEDNYSEVTVKTVLPGDVAVYFDEFGDIHHSGIVTHVNVILDEIRVPYVLGKWGVAHEVIHPYNEGPYSGLAITFYRNGV
jgi:hypothetical protein